MHANNVASKSQVTVCSDCQLTNTAHPSFIDWDVMTSIHLVGQ